MNQEKIAIVYAKRTPIGKFMGQLSSVPAAKLSAELIKDCVKSMGFTGTEIDSVILGQVLPAGCGQAPARQAAIFAGLSDSTTALTINKVCGSGMMATILGAQQIALKEASIVIVGGQENMSQAPHLLPSLRQGVKFGSATLLDHMQYDGLTDPYSQQSMGVCTEKVAKEFSISREAQDEYAIASYEKSQKAIKELKFTDEIVKISVTEGKKSFIVETDEEPFNFDRSKIATLRPAFIPDGTITAANASTLNDGASVLVLMSESEVKKRGIKPLAYIEAYASFAAKPDYFAAAPVYGIKKLLEKTNLKKEEIDFYEINEAFSLVPMLVMKELQIPQEKINPLGGAVSLGHPIGCSGARIITTLVWNLIHEKKEKGIASICIGGGESLSVLIKRAF